jgi:hypothetical protein
MDFSASAGPKGAARSRRRPVLDDTAPLLDSIWRGCLISFRDEPANLWPEFRRGGMAEWSMALRSSHRSASSSVKYSLALRSEPS